MQIGSVLPLNARFSIEISISFQAVAGKHIRTPPSSLFEPTRGAAEGNPPRCPGCVASRLDARPQILGKGLMLGPLIRTKLMGIGVLVQNGIWMVARVRWAVPTSGAAF